MKKCFVCGCEKALEEFYVHPAMGDGHLNKCKDCVREYADERRKSLEQSDLNWVEKELERHRKKTLRTRLNGKAAASSPESVKKWLENNREKRQAHSMVQRAIERGDLIPESCFCGEKAQAHHEDYSKPLDVVWLCPKHHGERHVEINRERRKLAWEKENLISNE